MRRYTTPTITLRISGIDLTGEYTVYVSIEQDDIEVLKTGDDLSVEYTDDKSVIQLYLTQEETAKFKEDELAYCQVNIVDGTGKRYATDIRQIKIKRNLLDEVI